MLYKDGPEGKTAILNHLHELLKQNKQPLHYSVLMEEVTSKFLSGAEDQIQAKARYYTWMNLDTRFTNMRQGRWGLRNWAPQKKTGSIPVLTLMYKGVEYDDAVTPVGKKKHSDEELFAGAEDLTEDDGEDEALDEELPLDDQDELIDDER